MSKKKNRPMKDRNFINPIGFDYDYFDNPDAYGYQGYNKYASGDQYVSSWDRIAEFCLDQRILTAVDLGCAKGFLVEALISRGIRAIGYDISAYALSFAEHLPCKVHDLRHGVPAQADAVFALGVLLYLEESEIANALRSIYGATHKLFLFSSYYINENQKVPDPLRRLARSRYWWRTQIEGAGFIFNTQEEYFDVYKK